MRQKLALAVAGLAAAAAFAPVQQASAMCVTVYTPVGYMCLNPCSTVNGVYRTVDTTAGGALPDGASNCVA